VVFLLNPLLSVVCMGVLDLATLEAHHRDVLAKTAYDAGGKYFGLWISADAALVLAGSVLTAYVGVTGLVRRLAVRPRARAPADCGGVARAPGVPLPCAHALFRLPAAPRPRAAPLPCTATTPQPTLQPWRGFP
jgi:hypothetical protein